ncbi:MAG: DMT family transporter [Opitutales bacterium]|nr:DMT family transporter [Opitutales bacterium]
MRAFVTVNFFLCIAFVLLWNSGYIAAKYVLPMASPLTLLAWRFWALALILGVFLVITGKFRWPGGKRAGEAMVIGILAHGAWTAFVLYALKEEVPSGIVALVVALQPLLTGILASQFMGERPSVLNWMGLVLGFVGVGVAVGSRTTFGGEGTLFGHLLPFGSVLAITVASLLQRKESVERGDQDISLDQDLFYQSFGAAVVVTVPAIVIEGLATEINAAFLGGMAWLVLGVSFGAYALCGFWCAVSTPRG